MSDYYVNGLLVSLEELILTARKLGHVPLDRRIYLHQAVRILEEAKVTVWAVERGD